MCLGPQNWVQNWALNILNPVPPWGLFDAPLKHSLESCCSNLAAYINVTHDTATMMESSLLDQSQVPEVTTSKNLNTEFQPRLLSANASFGLLLGRNIKEASSQAGHTRRKQTPKQGSRANLLIVILSSVQF